MNLDPIDQSDCFICYKYNILTLLSVVSAKVMEISYSWPFHIRLN